MSALPLLEIPLTLTRGEYLALHGEGLCSLEALRSAGEEKLIAILGRRRAKQFIEGIDTEARS
jgi:hypothetical protein